MQSAAIRCNPLAILPALILTSLAPTAHADLPSPMVFYGDEAADLSSAYVDLKNLGVSSNGGHFCGRAEDSGPGGFPLRGYGSEFLSAGGFSSFVVSGPSGPPVFAYDINDAGRFAGRATLPSGSRRPITANQSGAGHPLNSLNGVPAEKGAANTIDNANNMAGASLDDAGFVVPTFWKWVGSANNHAWEPLGVPLVLGSVQGEAGECFGMNDDLDLVGHVRLAGTVEYVPVLWEYQDPDAWSAVVLPKRSGDTVAVAYDINNNGTIVGWSGSDLDTGAGHAVIWTNDGSGWVIQDIHPTGAPSGDSVARAVNDAGEIVGAAGSGGSDPDDSLRAWYWRPASAVDHNLGDLACEFRGSASPAPATWKLMRADDIAEDGTIVGSGFHDTQSGAGAPAHAYVLRPAACPTDVDGSGNTGFGDVLLVLPQWDSTSCTPADVDGNGIVGFADLLAILANWDCTGEMGEAAPAGIMDCINRYPNDTVLQSKCIEAMILAGTP